MDTLLHDLRYAIRLLLKNPGFAFIAILTLALGIGATTAMFSVVNGVLLKPFPFSDPDQLVTIKERIPKFGPNTVSMPAPDVITYREQTKSFTDIAGYQQDTMDLTGHGEPRKLQVSRITWNTLPVLGVSPLIGRNFTAEEDRANSAKVVILSYRLWRSIFAGDRNAIGKTVMLNRVPYTVVAVMPESFIFPIKTYKEDSLAWVPMAFSDEELKSIADNFDYDTVARLKPGVSLQQAQADVDRVAAGIHDTYPAEVKDQFEMFGAVNDLRESALGNYRQPLLIMMMAVVLVLLIAIANVANLLLAKGTTRQHELSIRVALGARALRIFSQLISESVLLGLLGGVFGALLAQFGTDALVSMVPVNIPRLHATQMDWRVLLFVISLSIVSGIVFGMAPAFFALRLNLNDGLKEGGRSNVPGRQHRLLRTGFVLAQFSLALMLLIVAGLLIRSFQHMLDVDPGFRPDHVISAAISLPETAYKQDSQRSSFYKELLSRLSQSPGIQYAAASTDLPLESTWTKIFSIEGQNPPPGAALNTNAHTVVLGDFFPAMGIRLVRGRFFTDTDTKGAPLVVIINQTLADRYFHGENPIGHRIKWGPANGTGPWLTIVGVVNDVKQDNLDKETRAQTYQPYQQNDHAIGSLYISARTRGDAGSTITTLQQAVHSLDQQLPLTDVRTMEAVLNESTAPRRFYLILVVVFAGTAIVLAAVGLYGVVSYAVEQRTREIGIRMTLGATQTGILRMLLRWALGLAAMGIALGIVAGFAFSNLLTGLLFGIKPNDPLTYLSVALGLGAVSLLASYIPARRATKVDPMVALRYE